MHDTNETLAQALARNVHDALMDIGRGDWTAQWVPAGRRVCSRVVTKEAVMICVSSDNPDDNRDRPVATSWQRRAIRRQ